jgi:hypothetical protein
MAVMRVLVLLQVRVVVQLVLQVLKGRLETLVQLVLLVLLVMQVELDQQAQQELQAEQDHLVLQDQADHKVTL